ncbi:hypothetical protein FOL47_008249 [Perkinsus chesapeaki]|uniref:Peroxisomal ATPase PEX1 N-terminal C-lobe domain-containing protein n=1 Tax=Perkinsus chesapeaki TaxID=330153 RepID=A0A7J6LFG1_PERCH|nr:hypothetical protein FOL47_008249 [Perkinsus chesapeaki]
MSSLVKLKVSIKTVTTGDFISLHPDDSHSLFHGLASTGHFCRVVKVKPSTAGSDQYVGWAGHSATNKGTVEVSKPFASALGWVEGQLLELSGVDKVAKNTEPIVIRPCSSDDWEVVELQAQYLESALLSQIAVLYPGLKFPLWPEGGGKPIFMEAVWDASDGQQNSVPFRLLSDSDELAIEARPRKLLVPDSSAEVKRLCRIVCDGDVFPMDLYDKFAVTCVLHRSAGVTTGVVQLGDAIIAPCVVNNDLVDPGYALLHPLLAAHYPDVVQEAAPVLAPMSHHVAKVGPDEGPCPSGVGHGPDSVASSSFRGRVTRR